METNTVSEQHELEHMYGFTPSAKIRAAWDQLPPERRAYHVEEWRRIEAELTESKAVWAASKAELARLGMDVPNHAEFATYTFGQALESLAQNHQVVLPWSYPQVCDAFKRQFAEAMYTPQPDGSAHVTMDMGKNERFHFDLIRWGEQHTLLRFSSTMDADVTLPVMVFVLGGLFAFLKDEQHDIEKQIRMLNAFGYKNTSVTILGDSPPPTDTHAEVITGTFPKDPPHPDIDGWDATCHWFCMYGKPVLNWNMAKLAERIEQSSSTTPKKVCQYRKKHNLPLARKG